MAANSNSKKASLLKRKNSPQQSSRMAAARNKVLNSTAVGRTILQSMDRKAMLNRFVEEMRFLSKLRHPCITTVMGAVVEKNREPMLVMELMTHGSLFDLINNTTVQLEPEMILPILTDVVQGMRFLHSAKVPVLHGDLKAQNILVDSNFRAKVTDFGLTQKKDLGLIGTPYWMPPEVLKGGAPSKAADVYAFGVVLFQATSRREPYDDEDYEKVMEEILDDDRPVSKTPGIPRDCPASVKEMMEKCWARNPASRPSFEELDLIISRLDVTGVTSTALQRIKKQNEAAQGANAVLFDVFPKHVAEALVAGRQPEPDSREVVTIFFSDIVGFTTISSTVHPSKVSNMLHRLYTCFDQLSVEHDVFKVETIGDAYMAVTNLVKDQAEDHAARIARFSIAAVAAANQTQIDEDTPSMGTVQIRVGFHSGPCVAHVVGLKNPRYCLFGDTVNTASRMESNSVAGRIHCSASAARILKKQAPDCRIESRGIIEVKGKGRMHTYWVRARGQTEHQTSSRNLKEQDSFNRTLSSDSLSHADKPRTTSQPSFSKRNTSSAAAAGQDINRVPSYSSGDLDYTSHLERDTELKQISEENQSNSSLNDVGAKGGGGSSSGGAGGVGGGGVGGGGVGGRATRTPSGPAASAAAAARDPSPTPPAEALSEQANKLLDGLQDERQSHGLPDIVNKAPNPVPVEFPSDNDTPCLPPFFSAATSDGDADGQPSVLADIAFQNVTPPSATHPVALSP